MLRGRKRLEGVHPDLVRVIERAALLADLNEWDLVVAEGVRTPERQAEMKRLKLSMTLNSRHLTGHAVDLGIYVRFKDLDGDGEDDDGIQGLRWDWPLFNTLGPLVKAAGQDCGVPIEWGGDWRDFKDGPHFQLPWENYPLHKEQ